MRLIGKPAPVMVIEPRFVSAVIPCKIKAFKHLVDIFGIAGNVIKVVISTEQHELKPWQIFGIRYSVGIMLHKNFIASFSQEFCIFKIFFVAGMTV